MQEKRIGILFAEDIRREDSGLTSHEIGLCTQVATVSTCDEQSLINVIMISEGVGRVDIDIYFPYTVV